jgi:hypothetical protein
VEYFFALYTAPYCKISFLSLDSVQNIRVDFESETQKEGSVSASMARPTGIDAKGFVGLRHLMRQAGAAIAINHLPKVSSFSFSLTITPTNRPFWENPNTTSSSSVESLFSFQFAFFSNLTEVNG